MRYALIGLLLVAACQGKEAPKSGQPLPAPSAQVPESLPPMPAYPTPAGGRFAVQSAGLSNELTGEWPAEAGVCDKPAMLQVVAQDKGVGIGTIVLLALPEKDQVTNYPVKVAATGLPEPPASQVGAQVFRKEGPAAFQASEGSVDIYAYGKTVSGRFAVTMRQLSSNARIQYAGAFREIPVKQMDKSYCMTADSAASARR